MIAGVGVDLVDRRRIERLHERWGERFEARVLSEKERDELPGAQQARRRRLAMAFAAKEALGKALGTGMSKTASWHQVQLARAKSGAPSYRFGVRLQALLERMGVSGSHLSLTDDAGMVVAVAVLERNA